MSGFRLQRLGQIMEPEPGSPREAEGVLNPAAVRGPDGQLYLFPRLVARGNYSPWEMLKIGGGTPPILTRHGWLIVYHGVSEVAEPGNGGHHLCYSAGVMVLSKEHPRVIFHRSTEPVLTPLLPEERHGIVPNVVFPTGIDRRDDLGTPDRMDVYYGMADNRIGVARLDVPEYLPPGAPADAEGPKTGGPA